LQDGKNGLLERPEDGKTSRLDFVTTVGDEGLVVAIQPAESAETWGLALMEARPVKTP
jgi:hypothetical protein